MVSAARPKRGATGTTDALLLLVALGAATTCFFASVRTQLDTSLSRIDGWVDAERVGESIFEDYSGRDGRMDLDEFLGSSREWCLQENLDGACGNGALLEAFTAFDTDTDQVLDPDEWRRLRKI